MMLIEYGESAVAIDCGVMFPEPSMLGIDLVIPDLSYLREHPGRLQAIVCTHGHEDHIGALPFVTREHRVPTYATPFAHALVAQKLEEHDLATPLERFKAGDVWRVGPFEIEAIHITHSIVDAVALAIRTPLGTIVHTGDFKFDQTPLDGLPSDLPASRRSGTRACWPCSPTRRTSTAPVTPSSGAHEQARAAFRHARGRVLVATFASHLHRIQQVLDVSARTGRKVAVVGRGMVQNLETGQALGYVRVPPGLLVDVGEARQLPQHQLTLLSTGSQGEPMSALTRIAMDDHKQVKIGAGDTVIMSSRIIPGNEKPINDVINHLCRRGAQVLHDPIADLHVSGHASQSELKLMLQLTRPRYFVPVHGEYRHLVRHAALAEEMGSASPECFVLEDGDVLEIDAAGARRTEPVASGRVFVDGKGVGDVGDVVLRDRRHLSTAGSCSRSSPSTSTRARSSRGPTSSRAASSSRTTANRTSIAPRRPCSRRWRRWPPSRAPSRPMSKRRCGRPCGVTSRRRSSAGR
jgi:ribonuclease J